MPLSQSEKKHLLALARYRIEDQLGLREGEAPERYYSKNMDTPAGAFVSLHVDGALRGCIGSIIATKPLQDCVADNAEKSAFKDPRFQAVDAEEIAKVDIEISALTPLKSVSGWEAFEPGRHGIVMFKEGRTAVFLPQVAPEQGWDAKTTLENLSMKAGLRPDAYLEGAEFSVFEAEKFAESDPDEPEEPPLPVNIAEEAPDPDEESEERPESEEESEEFEDDEEDFEDEEEDEDE